MADMNPPRSGPRVIKLKWKVPARLRRPIRDQLARQRQAAQKRQAIVRFERRSISSDVASTPPPYQARRTIDASEPLGAEHHTGDVYLKSRPKLHLPVPPYQGRVLRVIAKPAKVRHIVTSPIQFHIAAPAQAPPLKKRKKIGQIVLLLIGCLAAAGLLVHLQGAGRALAMVDTIRTKASQAFDHLVVAQRALAEQDFAVSERAFNDAGELLSSAHRDLTEALASSRTLLRALDVSGTLATGEEVLQAGEALSQAGEFIVRGIEPLFAATVLLAGENQQPGITLVDALAETHVQLIQAQQALVNAQTAIDRINPKRLPADVSLYWDAIQDKVPKAQQAVALFLEQTQPLMRVLGADHDRHYLLVFENNHEIRPTGGFIGSLALINMSRGVAENISVKSVYDFDGQLTKNITPPEPLRRITSRWFLRDANFFVEWSASAQKIMSFLEKEKGPTVDGVIALTPEVIRNLLSVTGPIEMPTYDVIVTPDNFVALTQEEVTYFYDRSTNKPKQFLADLTPVLLNRLFANKNIHASQTLGVLLEMIRQKHLLIYFRDEAIQQQIAAAGWSGQLPQNAPALLYVNNMNIGGHKSDQFMEQEIDYRITIKPDGSTEALVTIRRTHHGPQEKRELSYPAGEDPAYKINTTYQRVLVPNGSTLLAAEGFIPPGELPAEGEISSQNTEAFIADQEVSTWSATQTTHSSGTTIGQEAGYTFFANWQVTRPGESTVGIYHYRLPGIASAPYFLNPAQRFPIHVVKQPGDTRTAVRVEVRLPAVWRVRYTTPHSGVTTLGPSAFAYRGDLMSDLLVGAVYEKL